MNGLTATDLIVFKKMWEMPEVDGRVLLGTWYSTSDLRRIVNEFHIVWTMSIARVVYEAGTPKTEMIEGTSRKSLIEQITRVVYELKVKWEQTWPAAVIAMQQTERKDQ